MTDLKQQVAKDLADSGLFRWAHKEKFGKDTLADYASDPTRAAGMPWDGMVAQYLPWPTAGQVEAVLGEMELQVVRSGGIWYIAGAYLSGYCSDRLIHSLGRLGGLDRTLANNAALAWLANQPDWKPKLKAALDRLGWV